MILRLGESCQDDSVRRRAGHGNIGHVAALTAHWNEVKPELGMHLPSSLCSEPRPPRQLLSRLVGVVAPAYDSAALRNQIMKQAKTAASLVKARLPRGLADRGADEIAAVDAMLAAIRCNYELYGFEAIETPAIEYTDALGKFLPDQDRPNDGVFSFQDDDEQWLSLRYDLTAPLARHFAENFESLPKPYRTLRCGFVFRNEKPGPGRFRQFLQFDADTIGSASPAADAELCMMAADTLEKLGIARGDYCIKVNNRKILDGVMEAIGLGAPEDASRRLVVLRAIDKLDRLGPRGRAPSPWRAGARMNPATSPRARASIPKPSKKSSPSRLRGAQPISRRWKRWRRSFRLRRAGWKAWRSCARSTILSKRRRL